MLLLTCRGNKDSNCLDFDSSLMDLVAEVEQMVACKQANATFRSRQASPLPISCTSSHRLLSVQRLTGLPAQMHSSYEVHSRHCAHYLLSFLPSFFLAFLYATIQPFIIVMLPSLFCLLYHHDYICSFIPLLLASFTSSLLHLFRMLGRLRRLS